MGKPVLVMRQNTECPEAVVAGTVKLMGTNRELIVAEAKFLLSDAVAFDAMANAVNPYGDCKGAQRAIAAIAELTGVGERVEELLPEVDSSKGPKARNNSRACRRKRIY